jgi:hypothetical protein
MHIKARGEQHTGSLLVALINHFIRAYDRLLPPRYGCRCFPINPFFRWTEPLEESCDLKVIRKLATKIQPFKKSNISLIENSAKVGDSQCANQMAFETKGINLEPKLSHGNHLPLQDSGICVPMFLVETIFTAADDKCQRKSSLDHSTPMELAVCKPS